MGKIIRCGRDRYINTALKDIEKRYDQLQAKANHVKCGDSYADFSKVKEIYAMFWYNSLTIQQIY